MKIVPATPPAASSKSTPLVLYVCLRIKQKTLFYQYWTKKDKFQFLDQQNRD